MLIIQSHYIFTWYTSPKNEGGKVKFGSWIWGKHQLLDIFYLSIRYARIKADRHQDHPEIVWRSIYGIEEMCCPGTKFAWGHSLFWYMHKRCFQVSIHTPKHLFSMVHTHINVICHMIPAVFTISIVIICDILSKHDTDIYNVQQKPLDAHVTQSAPCLGR